jgi:hypothetical protein
LSGLQYATGWLLIFLFGYGFVLPLFLSDLPSIPLIFPALILTFFTHATLGVRSTVLRYRLWRSWLDFIFFAVWLIACAAFVIIWRNG